MADDLEDITPTVNVVGADEAADALRHIGETGAEAFAKIADSAAEGNFTGLATLIGGPLLGALVAVGEAAFEFVKHQNEIVAQLDAVGGAIGTTAAGVQGLQEAFGEFGISSENVLRGLQRAAYQAGEQFSRISENIRDAGTKSESAAERVVSADDRVAESKQRIIDLIDEQSDKDTAAALGVEKAGLSIEQAQLRQQEDLMKSTPSGPFGGLHQILTQRQDEIAVREAQAQRQRAIDEESRNERDERQQRLQAEHSVRQAETGQTSAGQQQYNETLGDLQKIAQTMAGDKATGINLSDVSIQKLAEAAKINPQTGEQVDILHTMDNLRTFLQSDQGKALPQTVQEALARTGGLPTSQRGGDLAKVLEAFQHSTESFGSAAENATHATGALTDANVKAARSAEAMSATFEDVIERFKAQIGTLVSVGAQQIAAGARAGGGLIRGPGGATDDRAGLFALSDGEFVVRSAAVQHYGSSLFDALNSLAVGGFAGGGLVNAPIRVAAGTLPSGAPGSILNLTIDGEHFNGLRADADVAGRLKTYAIGRQTTQTGRKPSWVK